MRDKTEYKNHLIENITKSCKKVNEIDKDAKCIPRKQTIEDQTERIYRNEAYITIKDYKYNIPNKETFRVINPSNSDIGKLSKNIFDTINKSIISSTQVKL